MTSSNSFKNEIAQLVSELTARGGPPPSARLRGALESDGDIVFKKAATRSKRSSSSITSGVATGAKKSNKKDPLLVAQTISEISEKLRQAFESDDSFEAGMRELESKDLSKAHVVQVYQEVIGSSKSFPKNMTKDDLLNAIRKDRIMKLRAAS